MNCTKSGTGSTVARKSECVGSQSCAAHVRRQRGISRRGSITTTRHCCARITNLRFPLGQLQRRLESVDGLPHTHDLLLHRREIGLLRQTPLLSSHCRSWVDRGGPPKLGRRCAKRLVADAVCLRTDSFPDRIRGGL